MTIKILDAGDGNILLSANERAEVEAALQKYLARGSKVVTELSRVGQVWVAACTAPRNAGADETTTLRLSDIAKAQAKAQARAPGKQPNPELGSDGVCRVEKIGFQRMISGPSLQAVQAKLEGFIRLGATPLGEVDEVDGQWIALCDVARVVDAGFEC